LVALVLKYSQLKVNFSEAVGVVVVALALSAVDCQIKKKR